MHSKNILFISSSPPTPTTIGGNQRTRLLYDSLSRSNKVDFLLIRNPKDINEPTLHDLQKNFNLVGIASASPYAMRCFLRYFRFLWPSMLDRIAHHFMASQADLGSDLALVEYLTKICKKSKYDFIVARHLRSACLPDAFAQLPVLVDIDDLNSEVWESRLADRGVSGLRRAVIARHALSFRRDLPNILLKCAGVWVAKNSDRPKVETSTCVVLPNIPFHFSYRNGYHPKPVRGSGATILAVASFKHNPNMVGFDYFVRKIWPLIIDRLPLTNFLIVGAGIDDDTKANWESYSGVKIAGYVSDLTPYYEAASFTVAPLLSGGGTNIKVLESLAFGRACVCTQHAARGFDNAQGILIANSTEEFAEHCITLLRDVAQCDCIGLQGFDFVTTFYSMNDFDKAVDDLVNEIAC